MPVLPRRNKGFLSSALSSNINNVDSMGQDSFSVGDMSSVSATALLDNGITRQNAFAPRNVGIDSGSNSYGGSSYGAKSGGSYGGSSYGPQSGGSYGGSSYGNSGNYGGSSYGGKNGGSYGGSSYGNSGSYGGSYGAQPTGPPYGIQSTGEYSNNYYEEKLDLSKCGPRKHPFLKKENAVDN